jgi:hypothetical protein
MCTYTFCKSLYEHLYLSLVIRRLNTLDAIARAYQLSHEQMRSPLSTTAFNSSIVFLLDSP